MARSTFVACSVVVAFALAVPVRAAAQHAVPRNDPPPSSGSSSSGSSGSSGSSSSSESSSPPPAPAVHTPSVPDLPSGSRTRMSADNPSRSNPSPRVAPAPGGVVSARTASPDGVSSVERPTPPIYNPIDRSGGRDRNGQPAQGVAVSRGAFGGGGDLTYVSFPFYGPWGTWYPWYGSGFGYNLGFVSYNPWYYGATGWGWGRYGLWYDPYAYYGYDSYAYGGGSSGYSESSSRGHARESEARGSLRLKVNPSSARVYVDGALAGTVDDFDGFGNHLEIPGGQHQLEFRADGYETKSINVMVEVGKTITQRVSLKKQ